MTATQTFEIQGTTIGFPVVVRQARMANAVYTVPVEAVRSVVDDPSIEVVADVHGAATVVIGFVDYEDNDLGDYDEVMWSTMVRSTAPAGVEGTWIWRLPVNQSFTCEAGVRMLGLPKTVENIEVDWTADAVTCTLIHDGDLVMRQRFPRLTAVDPVPMPTPTVCLSTIDGVASVSRSDTAGDLRMAMAPDGYRLELGPSPWADELRVMGIDRTPPTVVTVCDNWSATFHPPSSA